MNSLQGVLMVLTFPLNRHQVLHLSLMSARALSRSLGFFLGWQVTRVSSYVRRPFPSKENRRMSERDALGPSLVPGGQEIGLGSRILERADR
jgi:hypothetical protein